MRHAAVLLLAVVTVLAACGGDDPPAATPTGDADAPNPETGDAIVATDAGKEFTLAPGEETNLRLSSEYTWDEPVVEGRAIELVRVDYIQDPGFSEWLVRAVEPGSAVISSHGEPACDGEHGCPDEPVPFQVTITVAE